ncbi:hypothetical protein C8R46DRAFT_1356103 [Mycena filopes]|nr:hypothetical protein C8R46DRAFT_1356103 [Mycena filopes]
MELPLPLDDLVSLQNHPLPASEARLAHSWILEAETESARVDEEIQTLELRRQNLETRRLELQRSLPIYRRAIAPHKTLPVELLREIFKFFGGPSDLNKITAPRSRDVHLALCGVCSRWRAVALGTHELWSDVRVEFYYRRHTQLLDALALWLSRTGSHAAALDLTCTGSLAVESPECVRIDQLIVQYSRLFRSLSLRGLPLRRLLFTVTPLFFERLEILALHSGHDDDATAVPPLFTGVVTPRLRSLTLSMLQSSNTIPFARLHLPWSTLTCLDLRSRFGPISDCYLVLEECKSLMTASFDLSGGDGDIHPADRDVFLPSLRELHLTADFFREAVDFLQRIVLDSLTDLEIETVELSDRSVTFVRSFPSLLRLHLHSSGCHGGSISAAECILMLHACPAAVAVSVEFDPSHSGFDQIEDGTLLPNLQQLGLHMVDPAILLRVLKSRLASSHSTITRAAAWPLRPRTADEAQGFIGLLDAGVFVSMEDYTMDAYTIEKDAREERADGTGYHSEDVTK